MDIFLSHIFRWKVFKVIAWRSQQPAGHHKDRQSDASAAEQAPPNDTRSETTPGHQCQSASGRARCRLAPSPLTLRRWAWTKGESTAGSTAHTPAPTPKHDPRPHVAEKGLLHGRNVRPTVPVASHQLPWSPCDHPKKTLMKSRPFDWIPY